MGPLGLALVVLVGLMAPAPANASGLTTGFMDNNLFASSDPSVRATWLDRAASDGAGLIRINVNWNATVASKPANPTDPRDPSYDFSSLDGAVESAKARDLRVMLTVLRAPPWAEGKHRPSGVHAGAWKPDPQAFGQFGQALAKRYSGSFLGLPRVRYFEAWNEPNISLYLAPQWNGKKRVSPKRYRRLLNAFYAGVKAAQPGALVIGGAMSPFGDPRTDPATPSNPRMRPLVFQRDLFCLSRKLNAKKCHTKPHLDVFSQHPINKFNSPHYSAISPDDVQVADFHNVKRVLRAAERRNHVRPGGHHPLWATEIFWVTKAPGHFGLPPSKEARWLEEGMYLLWKQGAKAIVNLQIRDSEPSARGSLASGVFFPDETEKPAYTSFGFPFVSHRRAGSQVGIWGRAPDSGTLRVQKLANDGWRTIKKVNVHQGRLFTPSIKLRGKAKLRGKIGQTTSLVWHQH